MNDPTTLQPGAVFDPDTEAGRAFGKELQRASRSIDDAADAAGLQRAASEIQALVQGVVEQAPAEPLTRLISTLNDRLTRRLIELTCANTKIEPIRWCWVALGSEGRQEQTLSSDQDNGIIFSGSGPDDASREALLPLARRINEALASCGFPLCAGQIMASNLQWCLSLHEWRNRFANWIFEGEPQALLNATIFFDLRALFGAGDLAQSLLDWLAENASDNPRFLFQMTENALRRTVPLGLLRGFAVEKKGEFAETIDLKLQATTLFADAARVYGLSCGSRTSNTADRLRLAVEAHRLFATDVEEWIRAFHFVQMLRLQSQHRCYVQGAAMHNHINPNQLDPTERHMLLHALHQARALQNLLRNRFLSV
jgi:CBS domain-containing protein